MRHVTQASGASAISLPCPNATQSEEPQGPGSRPHHDPGFKLDLSSADDPEVTTIASPAAVHTRAGRGSVLPLRPLSAALTFGAIGSMAIGTARDPDVFWHLRTGRWIWANHAVPKADQFSWTAPGRRWIAHEWLTEAVYASLHSAFGWVAIAVLSALVITVGWMFVHATCLRMGAGPVAASAATLLAAIASLHTWGTRPQMISLMFVAVTAWLLACAGNGVTPIPGFAQGGAGGPTGPTNHARGHEKRLLFAVPMMLLWANLHGGYIFGVAMLWAFTVSVVVERLLRRVHGASRFIAWRDGPGPDTSLVRYALLATVGATAITLINPNGVDGFTYPFSYLGSNASTKYVIEWFAPDFSKVQYWPFALVAVLFAVAVMKQVRTISTYLLSIGLPFAVLGFQSVRNITQFVIVAAPALALLFSKSAAEQRPSRPDDRKITAIVGAMMGVAVVVLSAPTLTDSANATVQAKEFPVAATEQLAILARAGEVRMFNQYDWGGYIMLASPELKVFVDGRPDMYGDRFIDRYMSTWWLRSGWKHRLDEDAVNTVIANPKADIIRELTKDPAWKKAYADPVAVILQRRR